MSVDEGQVGQAGPEGVDYGAVTSCLTVTVLLEDGNHVGGHLSLMAPSGALSSAQVFPEMVSQIAGRTVTRIHVAGQLDTWNSAYFNAPLYVNGVWDATTYPTQLEADGVGGMAMYHLGLDFDVPLSTETQNGAFTIKLTA